MDMIMFRGTWYDLDIPEQEASLINASSEQLTPWELEEIQHKSGVVLHDAHACVFELTDRAEELGYFPF